MSDFKMSDVFSLPMKVNGFTVESEPYHHLGSMGEAKDIIECLTHQEAGFVAHAINSHDKLTADLSEAREESENNASRASYYNGELYKVTTQLSEAKAENERLRESLNYFLGLPVHPTVWLADHFIEQAKAHKLLEKAND